MKLSQRARELALSLKEKPNDSFLKFALALELWRADFPPQKVEALFKSILSQDPLYHGLYYHYAKWLLEQERINEALKIYDNGIQVCQQKGEEHALLELKSAKLNAELDI